MTKDDLIVSILDKLGLFWDDLAYNKLNKVTYGDLISSIIEHGSMQASSDTLGVSERSLERIMPIAFRTIKKEKTSSWRYALMAVIDIRQCWSCKEYRSLSQDYYSGVKNTCTFCQASIKKQDREMSPDKLRDRSKAHYENNKHYYILKSSSRRLLLKQATPSWANLDLIAEVYTNCPPGCHVDHIIPLQGDIVCGLHVENNLQYLTATENYSKGNKYE